MLWFLVLFFFYVSFSHLKLPLYPNHALANPRPQIILTSSHRLFKLII